MQVVLQVRERERHDDDLVALAVNEERALRAVDNVVVDWDEQAALKAQSYPNSSSFSRSGLLEQLPYEGFTQAQASYGVSVAY